MVRIKSEFFIFESEFNSGSTAAIYQANLSHILDKSQAYLRDILGMGISQTFLRQISGIYPAYIKQISNKSSTVGR